MPINKLRGYYYGVGLKLDEKSINEVSNQIENKLNKAVGNVTKEITSLQEALKTGTSADFTPLVKSLGEAAGVINTVNDADFRALKDQVELMDRSFSELSETVKQLGMDLGNVTDKFSNTMDGLSAKIDRFMQRPVEMRNSMKQDLGNMTNMVKAYAEAIKINPNMDMSGIEAYFNEFKQQFSAISDLGEFATQEVANSFLKLGDVLRNTGLPFDGIRSELTQMTMQLEQAFTVKNADKAVKAFDVVGYKIDVQNEKLLQAKKRMQELEQEQSKLEDMLDKSTGKAKFTGGKIASEDELLSIEEKIQKIKQYDEEIQQLDSGSTKWIETMKKKISLAQNVEKELAKLGKASPDDKNLKAWNEYLNEFSIQDDKLSTTFLDDFTLGLKDSIEDIQAQRKKLDQEANQLNKTIAELAGQQAQVDTAIKKSNSPTAQKEQTEKTRILKLEEQVKLVADINQKEWMDTINKTINSINGATTKKGKSKIKSVKIPVEIKELEKLQEQLNKIATTSMVSDAEIKKGKNAGLDRDAVAFNKRIENLKKAIKEGKPKIKEEITAWQKEFNEAFNLEIKINGLDNDNFDTYDEKIINIVENINSKLEDHPFEFKSNITQLVESIQKELDKLEIKNIQVGGITATGASGGTLIATPMYTTQVGGAQPKIDTNIIQANQLQVSQQTSNTPVQGPEEKAWESRISKLIASWSAVSEKQKQLWDSKAKELLLVINKLSEEPNAKTLQNLLYQHPNVMNDIRRVRGSASLQNLLDQLQADAKGASAAQASGGTQVKRTDRYVADIVEKYLKQADKRNKETGKKTKTAAELSKNQEFIADLKSLQAIAAKGKGQAGQEYINLLLKWSSTIAALDSARPSGNVQQFLNEMVGVVTSYNEMFGGSAKNTAGIEQRKAWLQNGKEVIEYIIKLAEMAKNIQPITSRSGIKVTADMFKNGNLTKWIAGQEVTKEDIGAVIGKKDVDQSDVDAFLKRMGMTSKNLVGENNKDFAKYLNPLLTAINDFYIQRDSFVQAFSKIETNKNFNNPKEFISKFESVDSGKEGEFFAENLQMFKKISKGKSATKYQQHLYDVFKNNNINIDSIKKSKTNTDMWQIIQSSIFDNPNVDFNKLMTELRAGASKFGKSYQSFVDILEIAQKYAMAAQSLDKVGMVADETLRGKSETIIKNGKEKTVRVGGVRQELKNRRFVLTRKDGTTVGYGAGKGATDEYITGNSSSYTKIVNTLTSALKDAISIAFKPMGKGQNDPNLEPYKPGKNAPDSRYTVEGYKNEISRLQREKDQSERQLAEARNKQNERIDAKVKELTEREVNKPLSLNYEGIPESLQQALGEKINNATKELRDAENAVKIARQKYQEAQADYDKATSSINESVARTQKLQQQKSKEIKVPEYNTLVGNNYQELLFGKKDNNGNLVNSDVRAIVESAKSSNQQDAALLREHEVTLERHKKSLQKLKQQEEELIKQKEELSKRKLDEAQKDTMIQKIDAKIASSREKQNLTKEDITREEQEVKKAKDKYARSSNTVQRLVQPYDQFLKLQQEYDKENSITDKTIEYIVDKLSKQKGRALSQDELDFLHELQQDLGKETELTDTTIQYAAQKIAKKKNREISQDELDVIRESAKAYHKNPTASEVQQIFGQDWYATLIEVAENRTNNITEAINNENALNQELVKIQQDAKTRVDETQSVLSEAELRQEQAQRASSAAYEERANEARKVTQVPQIDESAIRKEAERQVADSIAMQENAVRIANQRLETATNGIFEGSNINEAYETIRQNVQYYTQEIEKLTDRLEKQKNTLATLEKDTNVTPEQKQRLSAEITKTQQQLDTQKANLKLNQDWEKQLRKEITQAGKDFKSEVEGAAESQKKNATTTTPPQSTSTAPTQTVTSMQTSSGVPVDGVQMVSGVSLTGLATEAKQNDIIAILKGGIKTTGSTNGSSDENSGNNEKDGKNPEKSNLSIADQSKKAQVAISNLTQDANVKIDSTGKQTINTVQKIGVETAKVTTTIEDNVATSTLELSNKNKMAMDSLFKKMQGYDSKYIFGGDFDTSEMTEAQTILTKYIDTYYKLDDARKQFEQSGNIDITLPDKSTKQLQTYIDELQKSLGGYEERLLSIAKNSQSFLGGELPFASLNVSQIKDSANSLKLLATNTEQWAVAFNGVQNNGKRLTYDVLKDGEITRYALEVDEATGNVRKFALSESALVNAFQSVNKVAKQGKELGPILKSDEVNQSATVIQNYQTKLKELYAYVRKAWDAARANGGLIPADEQNKIYAMSQEVQRLGAIIQSEYKKIANVIDSGAIFAPLGNADKQMVETQIRSYLNQFAEKQTMQVSNLQYDSVTRSMTADLVALDGVITKVRLDYNELLNGVQVSSAKGTVSIDKMATEMNKLGDTINTALNAGVINKNLAEYQAYETEVAKLNKLIDDIENGTVEYNIESIQAWNAQRQAVIDTGNAIAEIAKKNAQKSLPGVRAVETQTNRRIAIDNLVESLPDAKSTATYQKYIDAYEHLLELRDKFRSEGTLGLDANQKELQGAAEKAKVYGKELEDLIKKSIALRETAVEDGLQNVIDTDNIESQMKKFAGVAQNATQEQWKFNNATKTASYIVKDADNVVHEMAITYDEFTQQLVKTEKQHYKVQTGLQKFFTSVGSKFKEMARYFISFGSVYQVFGMIKQGVSYVKEIDAALTELKKVTDETDVEYNKFLQSMSKTAGVVGSTVQNLTTMAAEWARLGYSMEEAGKLAESTAILLNVSEFQDATTASEALISTMQAFQYVADDSQHVVDILNEVGNNYAVSSDGLATALQHSASALMEGGNNLEQSVALIAAANKVVQDPNSVGK